LDARIAYRRAAARRPTPARHITVLGSITAAAVLLVASTDCSAGDACPTKVSGPVVLGTEWIEITPPSPLVSEQVIQELHLRFPPGHEVDAASGKSDLATSAVQFVDGKRITFEGTLFDDKGKPFELGIGALDQGLYLSTKGPLPIPSKGPIFPQDRVYPKLRLRTSEPVSVTSIDWECRTPK
jgi:hypothetical protein